jgi:uncharacterized protein (DUF952 family)
MILHVCREEEWLSYTNASEYAPQNFLHDGFIHACTQDQLNGVLHRYFSGAKTLLLLYIDEKKLDVELRYEKSTDRELFPHIYGRINKDAIVKVEKIS